MPDSDSRSSVSFDSFELVAAERILLRNGQQVDLRGRAFDVFAVLVQHAGKVISKQDIARQVWPGMTVEDGALRVQIAAIRRVLGDGALGTRYIATISGHGYSFVAPIVRSATKKSVERYPAQHPASRLPAPIVDIVGRDAVVEGAASRLRDQRFITIVGSGGIGKTTVAVAIGHKFLEEFDGDVSFLSLAIIRDPSLLLSFIVSVLGLVQAEDALPTIIKHLRGKRQLLILDNCEHLIETVAAFAEKIFIDAPETFILATSREAMRVEGEKIWHLKALECPPEDVPPVAEQILLFPATALFVGRATANGYFFDNNDDEARAVAKICQKLDGVPLAIELAAGRATTFGLEAIANAISSRIDLLGQAYRTAVPRHQTLKSAIDWSYELLSAEEKLVFCRLSIFVGLFSLDAANIVVVGPGFDRVHVVSTLANLVEKSLIVVDHTKDEAQFRLFDATRSYAYGKLLEGRDHSEVSSRHANYYLALLERFSADRPDSKDRVFLSYWPHIGNIRAALEWSFSEGTKPGLAVHLAAASCRLFMELSLFTECKKWSERALTVLGDELVGTRLEMELQTVLGFSYIFTQGNHETAGVSLKRALELSVILNDLSHEMALLYRLFVYSERSGEFRIASEYADRAEVVAREIGDQKNLTETWFMIATSGVHTGRLSKAREKYDAAVASTIIDPAEKSRSGNLHFHLATTSSISRAIWLQGFVDQAVLLASTAARQAFAFRNHVSDGIAIVWGIRVLLWSGNLDFAQICIGKIIEYAEARSLAPYHALGRGLQSELLIRQGHVEEGMKQLREALDSLHALRHQLLTSAFIAAEAEGMALAGDIGGAAEAIESALKLVERNGDVFMLPELLRIKANILASHGGSSLSRAELLLFRSMTMAIEQGALSWELRSATSLAELKRVRGDIVGARSVLLPVYQRFTEGFDSYDVRAAKRMLEELS